MKNYIVTLIILQLSLTCFSQQVIFGKIESNADQKAIPYANIGIMNSPVGTLSNEDGTFTLSIPEKYLTDTVIVSALGFERTYIPVQHLIQNHRYIIRLPEKITTLQQVIVTAKKVKQKTYSLGNRYTRGGFLYADSISAGAAMGLLIDNKHPSYYKDLTYPFIVKQVRVFIDKNSRQDFKMRIRFIAPDSVGIPGPDLLAKDIIFSSNTSKGWVDIDVSSHQFVATQPFYLVLEWIMEEKDRLSLLNEYAEYQKQYPERVYRDSTEVGGKKIGFWNYRHFSPGTHLGVSDLQFSLDHYICFYRTHSFGEWKRSPVVLTARVDVMPVIN